jgi:hypothetical protein
MDGQNKSPPVELMRRSVGRRTMKLVIVAVGGVCQSCGVGSKGFSRAEDRLNVMLR